MLTALTVATLIAMSIENYPNNWRLAPNTTVVLMSAALAGTGLSDELRLAMLRFARSHDGQHRGAAADACVYAAILKRWPKRRLSRR